MADYILHTGYHTFFPNFSTSLEYSLFLFFVVPFHSLFSVKSITSSYWPL